MQILRNFTILTRLVLVWCVLSLGVAAASPFIQPQDILMVCSGSGAMKLLVQASDGSTSEGASNSMDCPLCLSLVAPPPVARLSAKPAPLLAYAVQVIAATHIAALAAAPLPARGPPTTV